MERMKIKITKESLLFQLPDGELPFEIILDGIPVKEEEDSWMLLHPDLYEAFTRKEWAIMREFFLNDNVTHFMILKYCKPKPGSPLSPNNAMAHVKNIRRKLVVLRPDWKILAGKHGYHYWYLSYGNMD